MWGFGPRPCFLPTKLERKNMIKVAHLAEFSPHRCGLYGTTRDMVMAERGVGVDAAFVDSHVTADKKQIITRPNLKDGDLVIQSLEWAKTADIIVHHSIVHFDLRNKSIPIVLALHGRPESTFVMEHRKIQRGLFGTTMTHGEDHRYHAFITFWESYMFHLGLQVPKDKLFYVPAMVDLQEYSPGGKQHDFPGEPRILVATMWRQDVTPFNVIMAAARFKEKYAPNAKINIIGAAPKKESMQALVKVLKGTIGEVHPLIANTPLCYRGADMVITPHNIATRVVREAMACGTPVVAGAGNPHTAFTADSRDADAFAAAMNKCWTWIKATEKKEVVASCRRAAEAMFNFKQAGLAAKKVYETVLENNKAKWTKQGNLNRKAYPSYDAYLKEQRSKLDNGIPFLDEYDKVYRKQLRGRLEKLELERGLSVLCLGARIGTEVKAFLDVGCFAVGIDLNPGKNNSLVVTGDFHKLPYADKSIDCLFTNSLDHVYRPQRFLAEATRVLRECGTFIIELEGQKNRDADKWASLNWDSYEDLVNLFGKFGLTVKSKSTFDAGWFKQQIEFVKGGA